MQSPFRIGVWSKGFDSLGLIGNPLSLTVYPRHNQQPTAQLIVGTSHRLAPALVTPGTRITLDYHGQQIMSGPIGTRAGDGAPDGQLVLQVEDDWGILRDILGWPDPSAALTAQPEYDTVTGPAETVVKSLVSRNAARLGLPVTVAPDLGRGATITVKVRMDKLADKLFPAVDLAGIGVTVRQSGAGLVVDCYTPATYPRKITPKSGVVTAWSWTTTSPATTRAVVGGQGDGAARVFRQVTDTAAESLWGVKREVFVDARDADTTALLDARGTTAVADGAAKTGLSLTLAETDTFRYGDQVTVGDKVTTQLVPGADPITDVLREAVLNWSRDTGFTATPIVGERTDDPSRSLARAVFSIGKRLRALQVGK